MSYHIIASTDESTVVAEYTPDDQKAATYQSEAELEKAFIRLLQEQGYAYIHIANEAELIENLRRQLEILNDYSFSNTEWDRFFRYHICGANDGIVEKTRRIQDDYRQSLERDDGSTKNIMLIDKHQIHRNSLQVLNQYEEGQGKRPSRYDVTILVNGLPLVHVELKRRGVAIREAFNQINRYQRESFWASSGLYEYIQIFIITNGTNTKYYSNTTRNQHLKEQESGRRPSKKTSHSFEFTSHWADFRNHPITDLMDFTKTFFTKHTLLNVLTRYCVFTAQDLLLVMRPYQIAATERILNRIAVSTNYRKTASVEAGGYIWHTTGSGKTLTSFKAAQLASKMLEVDKVLFVVDRKDLDHQTMQEYEKFEKGAANSNSSTRILQRQLEDPNARIIVTTIQKLDRFVGSNRTHPIYGRHVVIIFDECHRSQFGRMHTRIAKEFKNYHLFGFTGTPIFPQNAAKGNNPAVQTTEQVFGERLHTYTIVDAINDGNVLPFRIDYINTVKMAPHVEDVKVQAIDLERALSAPERIREIVSYILEHFDQKTKRSSSYTAHDKRLAGFNSILATSSIPMAMKYYAEFKRQIAEKQQHLKIAIIYSFSANEDDPNEIFPDESFDTGQLDKSSRDFLDAAIADYNAEFRVNFDTSADEFERYYKDLSEKVKKREVDLLIVVNMFLTGFDATTLNTLWVDKNLQQHGLIQAFSRTNRILNSVKTFGNIVCFRDLKQATDDALALFGNKEAGGIVLLKSYPDYYYGYDEEDKRTPGYVDLIAELTEQYPLDQPIVGEEAQKAFIKLYGAILRLRNILSSFDDFAGNEILSERDFQDYQSHYIDLYQEFTRTRAADKENINDDLVFEIELVKQIEVNVDYILLLVAQYHASNCADKEILVTIEKAINSSVELRSKKELIMQFIARVNVDSHIDEDWRAYVVEQKEEDLNALIGEENLKPEEARRFVDNAFRDGVLKTTGTDLDGILPPISRFSSAGENNRATKKQTVIERLMQFYEKFRGLI